MDFFSIFSIFNSFHETFVFYILGFIAVILAFPFGGWWRNQLGGGMRRSYAMIIGVLAVAITALFLTNSLFILPAAIVLMALWVLGHGDGLNPNNEIAYHDSDWLRPVLDKIFGDKNSVTRAFTYMSLRYGMQTTVVALLGCMFSFYMLAFAPVGLLGGVAYYTIGYANRDKKPNYTEVGEYYTGAVVIGGFLATCYICLFFV